MTPPDVGAFLALWNGISHVALQPEYETWHTFEHVPERVGTPGFIAASRYRSTQQPASYFTCYWLSSCEVLAAPQYQELLTCPTPWSARMRSELCDFVRNPCELLAAHGNSSASRLATLRLHAHTAAGAIEIAQQLQWQVDGAHLVCAHLGLSQPYDGFTVANIVSTRSSHNMVVMLQHLDEYALREATMSLLQQIAPLATALAPPAYYELLNVVRRDELKAPLSARQPARPDLFHRFNQGDKP